MFADLQLGEPLNSKGENISWTNKSPYMINKSKDGKNSLTNTTPRLGGAFFTLKEFEVWEIVFS
jgi:hypothetical protein